MLPSAAGSSATVLVAFATIGVSPAAMSAGKVRRVPPPAIELTIPASSAAPAPTRSCAAGMEVEEGLMWGSRVEEVSRGRGGCARRPGNDKRGGPSDATRRECRISRHPDTFRARRSARSPTRCISRENVDMSKTESNVATATAPGTTTGPALDIKDTRTGNAYTVPILEKGTEGDTAIRASELRRIKEQPDEFGLMTYDPAFMNTASCKSAITYIDGDKGILRYRGYPIEQLASSASFLEVAWLLRNGELPLQSEYDDWVHQITYHTYVHENIKTFLQGFRYDAHPMSMLCSAVAALSSFYPAAKNIQDPAERHISIVRLLAKVPTIAAFCFRHVKGLPFIYPDNELGYVENFLSMVARMSEPKYEGNPVFVKALEVLFILHADHEQNCSTTAVRTVGSSHADPFSAIAAGIAALYGPLHGGANEQVLHMINQIGHKKNIPAFIEGVKGGKGQKLMGFGHRVYKSYDPRARIVKKLADDVFAQIGMDKDLEIALELERIALSDDYFVSRKLYPNVDFYTGLIYRSMAFPTDFFTVLFAVARTAGWLAQWEEMLNDKEQKIARPRQIYIGYGEREYESQLKEKFPKTNKDGRKK
jgi:citrate synthase